MKTPITPPTPIYRGEVAELKSMLEDLQAKSQLPTGASAASISPEEVMSLMVSIERQALEIAWIAVDKSNGSEVTRDLWLAEAEIIAKYIKRRLGMPA